MQQSHWVMRLTREEDVRPVISRLALPPLSFSEFVSDSLFFSRVKLSNDSSLCGLAVIAEHLTLFISPFFEVSGFKCSDKNLEHLWNGIKARHSAFSKSFTVLTTAFLGFLWYASHGQLLAIKASRMCCVWVLYVSLSVNSNWRFSFSRLHKLSSTKFYNIHFQIVLVSFNPLRK